MSEHTEWCREHFRIMKPGGLWIIPRTGLVFRKTANALLWVGVCPPAGPRARPLDNIDVDREMEFQDNADEFEMAGVPLLKASVIRSFSSDRAALAHYGAPVSGEEVLRRTL